MTQKKQEMSEVQKRIQKTIELAEEERKRKLQAQRLEFVRTGLHSIRKKEVAEAVKAFHSYIKTLEELKGVGEGRLVPACFDLKKDQHELLMLCGIYWDLAKLYDRTRSKNKEKEFLHYLQKYVLFAKGMPFQALCAESLRKYISNGKAMHRSDFTSAYRSLSLSKCFVATALLDVISPRTLVYLQNFRDQVLKKSSLGRAFMCGYYKHGPKLAQKIEFWPFLVRKFFGKALDGLAVLSFVLVKNSSYSFWSKAKLAFRKADPEG